MAQASRNYEQQRTVMFQVRWAHYSGLCPVCKTRPCGTWPDGVKRITCGNERCFREWLPGRPDGDTMRGDES